MKVSLRVMLGVCFLIGALLFFYRGENHYALIFLVVKLRVKSRIE